MSVQNLPTLKKMTTYSQLKYIVKSSKSIKLISRGSYGVIYKITINVKGLENILQFVLKVAVIDSKTTNNGVVEPMYNGEVEAISKEAFISEHKKHLDMYEKFNMFGLNLVPIIYGSQPIFLDGWIQNNSEFEEDIMTFMKNELELAKLSFLGINVDQHNIGIILMECPVNYRTLQDILDDTRLTPDDKKRAIILGQSAHIQFMYQYDKYHGDPHTHNILININAQIPYPLYDGKYRGRAILIGFGRTRDISERDTQIINDNYYDLIKGATIDDAQQALVTLIEFIKNGFDRRFDYKNEFNWIFRTDYCKEISISCNNFTNFLTKSVKEKKNRESTRKKSWHRHVSHRRLSRSPRKRVNLSRINKYRPKSATRRNSANP